MMLKVKICGITNYADAQSAVDAGADALGFVFARSPRKVGLHTAKSIIAKLPPFVSKVGVFVNAENSHVLRMIKACSLDALQLHGEESDKYCAFLRKYCKIIKAFRIKDKTALIEVKKYRNVDAYLFDSYTKDSYGGTGKILPYALLKGVQFQKPIIIAGGIDKINFKKIVRQIRPFGLDICSSVEIRPGKKNLKVMQQLIKNIKGLR